MLEIFISLAVLTSGIISAAIAKKRNRNPFFWFLLGILFNVFAIIALFFTPTLSREDMFSSYIAENDNIQIKYSNKCPHCNSYFRMELAACPECNEQFNQEPIYKQNNPEPENVKLEEEDLDSDYLTCPSCRVINSMENEKCHTCGAHLMGREQNNRVSAA